MDSKAQLVKTIIKKAEPKPEFGKDPRDPWSVRANIPEEALNEWQQSAILMRYLKSKGIDPRYVTKDTMISHSKSGEFDKWKRDHAGMAEQTTEPSPTLARLKELNKSKKHQTPIVKGVAEDVDKKDTVTFDIPLLIRVLELAREDVKTDVELHKVVEKLIDIRDRGTLTMDDYEFVAKLKEELEIMCNDCRTISNIEYHYIGLKCKKCNVTTRDIKYDKQETNKLKNKFHMVELKSLSKKYCFTDGKPHQFITDEKTNKRTCKKCNKSEKDTYNHQELDKLIKNTNQNNLKTEIVNKLIYPTWHSNIYSNGKTPSFVYSIRDTWFLNSNILERKKFQDNVNSYFGKIGNFWANDPLDYGKGLKLHISKKYWLT